MSNSRNAYYRHSKYYETVLRRLNSLYKRGGVKASNSLTELKYEWRNIDIGFEWAKRNSGNDNDAALLCSLYPNAGTYLIHLLLPLPTRISWLEAGAAAAKNIGEAKLESFHLNNLGEAYYFAGQPRRAREHYLQALEINHRLKDFRNAAQALGNLGVVSAGLREKETAKNYLEEALSIFRETEDRRGEATALGDLGNIYKNDGDLEAALNLYQERLEISQQIEEPRSKAQALFSVGTIYRLKGDYEKSLRLYEESLAIARRIDDRRLQSNAHGNIGLARKKLGEIAEAAYSFHQQLNSSVEIGYRRGEASALWNISLVAHQSGNLTDAINYAKKALLLYDAIEHSFANKIRLQMEAWENDSGGIDLSLREPYQIKS